MNRTTLLNNLQQYHADSPPEADMLDSIISFVSEHEDCFLRSNLLGQVTASAWIIDEAHSHTLLVLHKKLGKWLQPGGHTDGDENTLRVARKEAEEETGLKSLNPYQEGIFDVDVHIIPAHKNIPEHTHFDVRYLFIGNMQEPLVLSDESNDLKWIPLQDIAQFNDSESVLRLVRKTLNL